MGFFRAMKRNIQRNRDLRRKLEDLEEMQRREEAIKNAIDGNIFIQKDRENMEKNVEKDEKNEKSPDSNPK